ncbi:MAG: hypothetical protein BGO08_04765 [Altererythrobacter sp. 66-12]|nr:MAG: hypothetical protein BGO08_04765 [Altererythrobacter sp. 66-12]
MLIIAAFTGVAWLPAPAAAKADDWDTAGTAVEWSLVGLALGKSVADEDWNGAAHLGLSVGAATGTTQILKRAFPETRPDGSDRRSLPSGHASTAFAAAGYLHQRYGWQWGLPATVAAGFVGFSRVEARKHHWYDVVAGAAIGEGSAFLLTSPRDDRVILLPWGDTHGAGIAVGARF